MSDPEDNPTHENLLRRKINMPRLLRRIDYDAIVRSLTGLLILVLALWMLAGIVRLVIDLYLSLAYKWTHSAEEIIVSALIMLALLEIIRTLQTYLELGRVRVTFILDTALVVLIGELIGLWFKDYPSDKVLLSLAVIATLVVLRIITAKYSKLFL